MDLIPAGLRKYWVRKDREAYLLYGAVVTGLLMNYASIYWHTADRMSMQKFFRVRTVAQQPTPKVARQQAEKLQDTEYIPTKKRVLQKYYKLDGDTAPSVPGLKEDGK